MDDPDGGTVTAVARLRARLDSAQPPLAWTLRRYRRDWLRGDLLAGVTVAALILPLSIGYAQVAGLPPEAGLYASLVPLIAYAVFGSARLLIVGPDAGTAALVAAAIVPLAAAPDERLRLASALALLVAVLFVGMRLASLGFLADFLSRPILVGYMSGVGLSVAFGQIPKILGDTPFSDVVSVLRGTDLTGVGGGAFVGAVGAALGAARVDIPSVIVGGLVFAAILVGDRRLPGIPIALPAMVVALIASSVLDLQAGGMQVLGPVPPGLPPVGLPLVSVDEALNLLPGAIGIAILSFADTALTGRSFAARRREETSPDRELVALSMADLGASLTSGYPVSSSPSRTSAAEAAGSKTQLTGIVAAGAVALILLFATGPLAALPIPALGAVVLASAIRFIDLRGVRRIWQLERVEGAIAIAALLGVLIYGTLAGVGIAVLLAAVNVFRRAAQPQIEELGRIPGTSTFASLDRESSARRVPGVLIVRYAGPLFFATATGFRHRIHALLIDRPDVRRVVVDAAPIVDLDLTAAESLQAERRDLADRDIELILARPTGALRDLLRAYGLGELAPAADLARRDLATVIDAAPGPSEAAASTEMGEITDALTEAPPIDRTPALPLPPGAPDPKPHRRWSLGIVLLATLAIAVLGLAIGLRSGDAAATDQILAPNLIGLSYGRARTTTDAAGLTLGEPDIVRSTALAEGTVVAQDPGPGTTLAPGAVIVPTVSTAHGLVIVPDVAGLAESQAIVRLTTTGLRVGQSRAVEDATVPRGVVLATQPEAGRAVAQDTSVTLVVSSGPTAAPGTAPPPTPGPTAAPTAGTPSRTPASAVPATPTAPSATVPPPSGGAASSGPTVAPSAVGSEVPASSAP